MSASSRWLVAVGVVTLVLVGASLAVALLAGGEAELDAGTPEGTVQAYLKAIAGGDATEALEFFAPALRERCDASAVRDSLRYGPAEFRASLGDVRDRDGHTEVTVSVTQIYGDGPFDRGESSHDEVFVLEQSDGWRFAEPPWPTWCPQPVPAPPTPPAATPSPSGGQR